MTLHWETLGQGRDIVLLHGWGMNSGVWEPLLPFVTENFRVTLIELPGHGGSPFNNEQTLNSWARACLAVAPNRASWVGWSLGGLLAIEAAQIEPEKFNTLCLVSSSPCFCKRDDWESALEKEAIEDFAKNFYVNPKKALKRFLSLQVKGVKNSQSTLRLINETLALRPSPKIEALETGLQILMQSDLREKLSNSNIPINFLLGERDTIVPIDLARKIKTLLPTATMQIVNQAGHAPILSHLKESSEWLVANCG